MVLEALIGAALVRLRLVENDASALRAIVMPLHLVNTSALTAALSLAAWASQHGVPKLRFRGSPLVWACAAGLALVLAVSITGAVTALGDTLYPVQKSLDLAKRLASDHESGSHFLRQLRIVHPLLAFGLAGFLFYLPFRAQAHFEQSGPDRDCVRARLAKPWLRAVWLLASAQVTAGVLNIWLSAPGYMQVVHLALASGLWIALVLSFASLSAVQARPSSEAQAPN
jgi:heme A synthase